MRRVLGFGTYGTWMSWAGWWWRGPGEWERQLRQNKMSQSSKTNGQGMLQVARRNKKEPEPAFRNISHHDLWIQEGATAFLFSGSSSRHPLLPLPPQSAKVARSHTRSTHAVRQVCLPWPQGWTSPGPIALQIISEKWEPKRELGQSSCPGKAVCKGKTESDRDQNSKSAHRHW